ncbi:LuxR C-terminal-related transcriptional regulator [Bradyrhizobium ottawaense]|uniref:DNA-binding NarL/FixJ family response regulator n=1 Tax=Bradyrhizobium ottawaense TaxID=931866 RepID=A0ABV4FZ26_9BRAD|nr:LuxR C-terminal-related transcriptional regulator [Bradyrhizobium ottawaense]WLB49088.1 LuxR C-terminal-related transcriptional regulator [Bradyrhizobium ottawaense]WQN79189.1 LuxR C-terminal-related transcriptional regulator [Bradyrhizobium ottawaense]
MLDVSVKQRRIRLLIVDRQPIVLQGLKSVLGAQQDFDVVASCSDGTRCLEAIRNLTPDVTLVADNLPDLTVPEILAIAKAENLSTRLVLFTESEADHDLAAAIAAGASSVISKHASSDTMLRLLRLMTERSVSREQSDLLPAGQAADGGGKVETMLELLTHRELQIVRLVSEGMSNKEIARQLNVSPGTVKVHLYNIFQKLEITNRTVLATLALLQRPSGFGLLALAFLAFAIADELKASEANDVDPDDDSVGRAGEHAEYEPWKRAILRHLVAWESGETSTQRDFFAKASLVTNPAEALGALSPAEQSAGSKTWKDHGPVGSSTPNLPTPLLRGTSDTQIVGDPTSEHQFPRLASTPTSIHGGYGTFATLTGALIYALNDPHLAVQSHDPGKAPIDSFVVVTGENATTKLASITDADTNDVDGFPPAFPLHDLRLPAALVTTGNERVAGEGASNQMSHGAADHNLQEPHGSPGSGRDAGIGGDGRDQRMGGDVGENVVYRSPIDSNSTSSHSGFDFASGSSRINLAAFGALAWLHMTAASKSIPPHTLAWIYNPATNETIVYVNPTDRSLDVGDRGLLEIHLQGIVSIAESDFVGQPEGAAVAITLDQLEALTSATATEAVLSADSAHTVIGTSESALGSAAVWSTLTDNGLTFGFGQARTGSGGATRSRTFTSDSVATTDESDGGSGGSAHVSPIALAHSATVTAVENLTSKNEPINGGAGSSSAAGDNSQHASEPGSAKAAAESTEAGFMQGNGVGNDNENHPAASGASRGAAKSAEADGVEHGNSGHSTSGKPPEAADPGEPGVAKAGSAGGNSQHASKPPELTEAGFIRGNGVGNDNEHHPPASEASREAAKTAEADGVEHGNSGHSTSAKPTEAAAPGEPGVAKAGSAGGNSQHASKPPEPTEAGFIRGNGVGNDNEHHPPASEVSRGAAKTAEADGVEHGNSGHSTSAKPPEAADPGEPGVAKAGSAGGNSQHASKPPELTEAGFIRGNGAGNDNEHHSPASEASRGAAKTAEADGVEHGNSGHSTSAKPPEAADPGEPGVAKAGSAGGNSQHASKPPELTEAGFIRGNGAGSDNEHHSPASDASPGSAKTADADGLERGNSGHSTSAKPPEAADPEPGLGSAGRDNSQHNSEPGSAKAAVTELTEAGSTQGHSLGNDNEHHFPPSDASPGSAKTADADGVERGHSGHSTLADAPEAAELDEPSVATAGSEGRGDSQHVSKPGPAKAAATELTEAGFAPGNGAEHQAPVLDVAAASAGEEPTVVEHGNSEHDLHGSKDAPEAAEMVKPSVANGGDSGNWPQAAQPAATALDPVQPAKVAFEIGGAELAFRFDSYATPPTFGAVVELDGPPGRHVPPGQEVDLHTIGKSIPDALDEHAVAPVHNVPHHAVVPAPHDLLI